MESRKGPFNRHAVTAEEALAAEHQVLHLLRALDNAPNTFVPFEFTPVGSSEELMAASRYAYRLVHGKVSRLAVLGELDVERTQVSKGWDEIRIARRPEGAKDRPSSHPRKTLLHFSVANSAEGDWIDTKAFPPSHEDARARYRRRLSTGELADLGPLSFREVTMGNETVLQVQRSPAQEKEDPRSKSVAHRRIRTAAPETWFDLASFTMRDLEGASVGAGKQQLWRYTQWLDSLVEEHHLVWRRRAVSTTDDVLQGYRNPHDLPVDNSPQSWPFVQLETSPVGTWVDYGRVYDLAISRDKAAAASLKFSIENYGRGEPRVQGLKGLGIVKTRLQPLTGTTHRMQVCRDPAAPTPPERRPFSISQGRASALAGPRPRTSGQIPDHRRR